MSFLAICFAATVFLWSLLGVWKWRQSGFPIPFGFGGALVVVSGCIVGYHFFNLKFGPIPLTIDRGLWGLLILAFVICVLHGRERIHQWDRTDLIVLTFLGIVASSTFTHDYSFKENLPLSRLLFFYLIPIGLYFLVKHAKLEFKHLDWISWSLISLGIYLSLIGIAEWRGWNALVFPRYISDPGFLEFLGRARGPLLNPIINGLLISTSWFCLLMRWPQAGKLTRSLTILTAPLFAVAVYATLTRSVWLGLAFAFFLSLWIVYSYRVRGVLVMATVLAGIGYFGGLGDAAKSFKRDKTVTVAQMEQSAQLRPIFAEVAVRMFRDRPLWGCGFGQYTISKVPYLDSADTERQLAKAIPYMQHNTALSFLTETGLVGTIWLLLLYGNFCWIGWRLWKVTDYGWSVRSYGLLLLAVMTMFIANGLFHDVTIIPMSNTLMFFVAALGSNLFRQSQVDSVRRKLHANKSLKLPTHFAAEIAERPAA